MGFVARFIGGVYVRPRPQGRSQRPAAVGGGRGRRSSAKPWRCSNSEVFGPEAYQIPTKLYNYLAPAIGPTGDQHPEGRPDVAIHDLVLQWQDQRARPSAFADHALAAVGFGDEGARRPGRLPGGRACCKG